MHVSTSGKAFQGMFLQARTADGRTAYGSWDTPASNTNTRTMTCNGDSDTITHSNTNSKTTVTFTWYPPDDDVGNIYIYVWLPL